MTPGLIGSKASPWRTAPAVARAVERVPYPGTGSLGLCPTKTSLCSVRSSKTGGSPTADLCVCVFSPGAGMVAWAAWNMGSSGSVSPAVGAELWILLITSCTCLGCRHLPYPGVAGKPCTGWKEDLDILVSALCSHCVASVAHGPSVVHVEFCGG